MHTLALNPAAAYGLATLAVFVVVQVVIATVASRRAGHVPGAPIQDGPRSFAFRAQRAHQNTLENAVPFLIALAAALAIGAPARVIDFAVLGFLAARVAHAVAYYANAQPPRSAAFATGLVAVLALSIATFATGALHSL